MLQIIAYVPSYTHTHYVANGPYFFKDLLSHQISSHFLLQVMHNSWFFSEFLKLWVIFCNDLLSQNYSWLLMIFVLNFILLVVFLKKIFKGSLLKFCYLLEIHTNGFLLLVHFLSALYDVFHQHDILWDISLSHDAPN